MSTHAERSHFIATATRAGAARRASVHRPGFFAQHRPGGLFESRERPIASRYQDGDCWPRQAAEAVRRGARALHEDELRTVPARHKEALEYAYKVVRPGLMASDAATARLNAEISGLKAKISTPPPIDRGLGAEIRAALSRMPRDERTKAVLTSMKSGSDDIVSACLGGPGLLSGMSDTAHSHVRNSYAALRHPDTVKRIAALEKGMEHLERAAKLTLQYSLAVADRQIVDRATASAKRAAEAMAEANRPLLN